MGDSISISEFKRIQNQHGRSVAEAASRGEHPDLLSRMRNPVMVSDPDSEEVERPSRPAVDRRPRTVTMRPSIFPNEASPVGSSKGAAEPPRPSQPILNPIQAQFAGIAWTVQRRLGRPPTQPELEIIREKIYFGGNFFASMGMLERAKAVVRDDEGETIRYRFHEPRVTQLQTRDYEIVRLAVAGIAAEFP